MHLTAKLNERHVADMPLTIAITMTVDEWRDTMRSSPPLGFHNQISTVLGHISRMAQMTIAVPQEREDDE